MPREAPRCERSRRGALPEWGIAPMPACGAGIGQRPPEASRRLALLTPKRALSVKNRAVWQSTVVRSDYHHRTSPGKTLSRTAVLSQNLSHAARYDCQTALFLTATGSFGVKALERDRRRSEKARAMRRGLRLNDEGGMPLAPFYASGSEAAATDWPTRRIISSGSVTLICASSSGYSSASTRLHSLITRSPPTPEATRPSTRSVLIS